MTALRDETQSQSSTALFASAFRHNVPARLDDRLGGLESLVLTSRFESTRRRTARALLANWADRASIRPGPDGSLLVIEDQPLVFAAKAGAWIYKAGWFYETLANSPAAGLGVNDVRLVFRTSDTHQTFRWSGSAFVEDLAPALLRFGGLTSSFPALARSGAKLQVVTADNGGLSDLEVLDEPYSGSWDNSLEIPTKGSVYDRIETLNARQDVIDSAWTAWVPIYTSDIGNTAATFTATPTTVLARYKVIGKTAFVTVYFVGALNAVTPAYLILDVPAAIRPHNNSTLTPCTAYNNGVYETGILLTVNANTTLRVYRPNNALFTASGGAGGLFSCAFEIA